MTLTVSHPATLFEMAELGGARSWIHWRVAREMWREGSTWSLRHDGRIIGLFGLYPIEGGAEAWFNVAPEAGRHMGFLIRQIRLTLASASYPEIVVICTTRTGSRIARLAGFRHAATHERGEIWHGEPSRWREQQGGGKIAAASAE